jgi:hypothetical protein
MRNEKKKREKKKFETSRTASPQLVVFIHSLRYADERKIGASFSLKLDVYIARLRITWLPVADTRAVHKVSGLMCTVTPECVDAE